MWGLWRTHGERRRTPGALAPPPARGRCRRIASALRKVEGERRRVVDQYAGGDRDHARPEADDVQSRIRLLECFVDAEAEHREAAQQRDQQGTNPASFNASSIPLRTRGRVRARAVGTRGPAEVHVDRTHPFLRVAQPQAVDIGVQARVIERPRRVRCARPAGRVGLAFVGPATRRG
jgi:hypothetical protein